MADDTDEEAGPESERHIGASESWRRWIEVGAKVIGALALAGVTIVGYAYQAKMSTISLLNQREQAESQLRAAMLHDLIEPIIGRPTALKDMDPNRERLLVELLALNFHDHFEFKPLLEEVDKRLTGKGDPGGRERLASVARKVIDRQTNMLRAVPRATKASYPAEVRSFTFKETGRLPLLERRCIFEAPGGDPEKINELASKLLCVPSPDKKFCLAISLYQPDYKKKNLGATIDIYPTMQQGCGNLNLSERPPSPISELEVSTFDFPLTDNTEIDPEHRFALVLYYLQEKGAPIQLKLIWFPEGYVTERERPINYLETRKVFGVGRAGRDE